MREPQWLEDRSVLEIHRLQLEVHGGMAGVRDPGMLSSALHRPRNLWAYARSTADIPALAAAYAAGISRNHPFIDGNKRTAAVACETFLALNGFELTATDDQWYEAMINLASGQLEEEVLVEWIRCPLRAMEG